MKHSFKNLFMVVMILVSLIGSSIQTTPVNALGSLTKVPNLSSPGVAKLSGVWSADANNVFSVGYGSTSMGAAKLPIVYRGSGTNWTYTNFSTSDLPATWGNGEFYAVWGANTSNVFAVGTGGPGTNPTLPMAFRWNGTNWTSYYVPLPTTPVTFEVGFLYGVWGTSASNVYAVGSGNDAAGTNYPIVSHWNGSSWSSIGLALPTNPDWHDAYLRAIWGSSATDIWAAGNGENSGGDIVPVLYHYNGTGWSPATRSLPPGWSNGYLYGIWGSSGNDIYAVGSGTNASDVTVPLGYRYNGSTWTSYTPSLPSTSWESGELMSVWGVDANNIYAVG
ncbi:MAG TPA: hypothetical protein VFQ13_14055, partial [Anaerolineales bacterium]|nr:hypothetical protein [Anaerolineales bacterium]